MTTFADDVIGLAEAEDAFNVVGMIEDEEATIVLLDVAAMELDAAFELVAAIDDEASSPLQSECIRIFLNEKRGGSAAHAWTTLSE